MGINSMGMTSREIIWQTNFEELKAYVAQTGHFPGKHTRLNNWCRYQRKRIKAGLMPEDQRAQFEELAASRSDCQSNRRSRSNGDEMPQLFSFSQPDIASI